MSVILNSNSLICRNIIKQFNPALRNISFLKQILPQSVLLDKSKHHIIYEFPYARQASYAIRTKIWVPALITLVTPVALLFDGIRVIILGIFLSSWLHFTFVHVLSKYFNNTIGKIYINKGEECSDVIISSLDSKGARIDRNHKPDDLIVCDFSSKLSSTLGFITISVQNTDIIYKLNFYSSKIHNPEACSQLFGSKWNSKKK